MNEFRVLVCGGREYADKDRVFKILDTIVTAIPNRAFKIIHGNAKGADSLADEWAKDRKINVDVYPADWDTYGNRAGFIRNKQMLDEGKPHVVVAFPGGIGTRMMVGLAKRHNIPTKEYF